MCRQDRAGARYLILDEMKRPGWRTIAEPSSSPHDEGVDHQPVLVHEVCSISVCANSGLPIT
jgi:hypothetical protein